MSENTAVTDTTDLRETIERRAAVYFDAIAAGATFAQQLALLPIIIRLYRLLLTIERRNRTVIVKARMLSNPKWRERVYAELGGWWAAKRWKNRMRASQIVCKNNDLRPRSQPSAMHKKPKPSQAPNYARYKTDSFGHFRWASIPRGKSSTPKSEKQSTATESISAAPKATAIPPIPLTTQDFERAEKVASVTSEPRKSPCSFQSSNNRVRDRNSTTTPDSGRNTHGPAPPI